jgi:hypothetical protein
MTASDLFIILVRCGYSELVLIVPEALTMLTKGKIIGRGGVG